MLVRSCASEENSQHTKLFALKSCAKNRVITVCAMRRSAPTRRDRAFPALQGSRGTPVAELLFSFAVGATRAGGPHRDHAGSAAGSAAGLRRGLQRDHAGSAAGLRGDLHVHGRGGAGPMRHDDGRELAAEIGLARGSRGRVSKRSGQQHHASLTLTLTPSPTPNAYPWPGTAGPATRRQAR